MKMTVALFTLVLVACLLFFAVLPMMDDDTAIYIIPKECNVFYVRVIGHQENETVTYRGYLYKQESTTDTDGVATLSIDCLGWKPSR